jgi:hypothetical protein
MLPVLFVMLCHLFTGRKFSFDSHNVIHKDNTFLQTAHGLAKAKGLQSRWVYWLLLSSPQIYPYLAVPFTLPEYIAAYKHVNPPRSVVTQVPYYTVPMEEHFKGYATNRSKRDLFHQNFQVATPTQRVFSAIIPHYGITVALDEIRD